VRTRPEERHAAAIVAGVVGATRVERICPDAATGQTYDWKIHMAGREIALEVWRQMGERSAAFARDQRLLSQPIRAHALVHSWELVFDLDCHNLRRFSRNPDRLIALLRKAEGEGRMRLGDNMRPVNQATWPDLDQRLWEEFGVSFAVARNESPPVIRFSAIGDGGVVPNDPVGEVLRVAFSDNKKKLGRAWPSERHLFVWLEHGGKAGNAVSYLGDGKIPADPRLPAEINSVWIAYEEYERAQPDHLFLYCWRFDGSWVNTHHRADTRLLYEHLEPGNGC
jgi:hypothetical protein